MYLIELCVSFFWFHLKNAMKAIDDQVNVYNHKRQSNNCVEEEVKKKQTQQQQALKMPIKNVKL